MQLNENGRLLEQFKQNFQRTLAENWLWLTAVIDKVTVSKSHQIKYRLKQMLLSIPLSPKIFQGKIKLVWKSTVKQNYVEKTRPINFHFQYIENLSKTGIKISMSKLHRLCIHQNCIEKFPQWWNLAQLYIIWRKSKKYLDYLRHSLSFANISIFYWEIQIKATFQCLRSNLFGFFKTWKTFLINMIAIFKISVKMVTVRFLKI